MLIVKTTGPFTLYDPVGQTVQRQRPSVVRPSHFISDRCASGQIEILATGLPGTASDEAFALYWEEAPDIAVEAYRTSFGPEPEATAAPRRGRAK